MVSWANKQMHKLTVYWHTYEMYTGVLCQNAEKTYSSPPPKGTRPQTPSGLLKGRRAPCPAHKVSYISSCTHPFAPHGFPRPRENCQHDGHWDLGPLLKQGRPEHKPHSTAPTDPTTWTSTERLADGGNARQRDSGTAGRFMRPAGWQGIPSHCRAQCLIKNLPTVYF